MNGFLINEIFLYLALAFVVLAFFLWLRSRKRRKKELEQRRSLSQRIRDKMKKDNRRIAKQRDT